MPVCSSLRLSLDIHIVANYGLLLSLTQPIKVQYGLWFYQLLFMILIYLTSRLLQPRGSPMAAYPGVATLIKCLPDQLCLHKSMKSESLQKLAKLSSASNFVNLISSVFSSFLPLPFLSLQASLQSLIFCRQVFLSLCHPKTNLIVDWI